MSPRGLAILLGLFGAATMLWFGCSSPTYTLPHDSSANSEGADHAGGAAGLIRSFSNDDVANSSAVAGRNAEVYSMSGSDERQPESTQVIGVAGARATTPEVVPCELAHAVAESFGRDCALVRCQEGWADCNDLAADGCEVNLRTDPTHCGGCDTICSKANGDATCSAGQCTITCATGYADCDAIQTNGCEASLMFSVRHCGQCGRACADATNGTALCREGNCGLSNCVAPYGDCDGNSSNGCESNGETDANNCGGCGVACSLPHAAAACANRSCIVQICEDGWADCNGVAADGCESQLSSNTSHCGACNARCAPAAGVGACAQGKCTVVSCDDEMADCNQSADDGCETSLVSDLANCGACGVTCSAVHGSPSCEIGACAITCASDYADCDGNATNGCETETLSNLDHCGGCNKPCEGKCLNGTCHTWPCAGLCADPKLITVGTGTISGVNDKVCHQSYDKTKTLTSGNCGQFAAGHKLYVNGVAVQCDGLEWGFNDATRPRARYGGYCFYNDESGGNGETAWFNPW